MSNVTTFDTLMYAKRLQEKGFTADQAEVQVEMLKEVMDTQLATKYDMEILRHDLEIMKKDLTIRIGLAAVSVITILAAIIKL